MKPTIDLVGKKDADRVFWNAVIGIDGIPQWPKGTVITYWTGNAMDEVNHRRVGAHAWRAYEAGRVRLFQKKVDTKMTDAGPVHVFDYMAVIL